MKIQNISLKNSFVFQKSNPYFAKKISRNEHSQLNYDAYSVKQNYKTYIQSKLKNKDILYSLYSDKDTGIPKDILNDENIMSDLYQDPEFLNASVSALKLVIEDKLNTDDLSQEDRATLSGWHNIFAMQEALYNDPSNSFETDAELNNTNNSKDKEKGIKYSSMPFIMQPSFGSIFNYGFFKKPKTRKQKAEALVNRYASAAVGAVVGGKAVSIYAIAHGVPIPSSAIDTPALTIITNSMCHHICKTYEMPGGVTTAITSKVIGRLFGTSLANGISKLIPGIGSVANATSTYALHQATGRVLIEFCEKNYKNKNLETTDAAIAILRMLAFAFSVDSSIYNPVDHIQVDELDDYIR